MPRTGASGGEAEAFADDVGDRFGVRVGGVGVSGFDHDPHERLGSLIDDTIEPLAATATAAEVARILASYNLVSVPVVDQVHRLVGVVSVDDVLDYLLPEDWRSHSTDQRPVSFPWTGPVKL